MDKPILSTQSSKEHYAAKACIVWCFDNRFRNALFEFAKSQNLEPYDLVMVAGGAKSLASPNNESDRDYVLSQIETSLKLHRAGKIVLMTHSDCGAYGGLKSFGNDPKTEFEKHGTELSAAQNIVQKFLAANDLPIGQAGLPRVPVEMIFVDFETVWEI